MQNRTISDFNRSLGSQVFFPFFFLAGVRGGVISVAHAKIHFSRIIIRRCQNTPHVSKAQVVWAAWRQV